MKTTTTQYGQLLILLFIFGFGIVTSGAQVEMSGNNIRVNTPGVSIDLSGVNTSVNIVDDDDYDDYDDYDDMDIEIDASTARVNVNNNLTGVRINQK